MRLSRPVSSVVALLILAACSSGPEARPPDTFGTGGSFGAAGSGAAGTLITPGAGGSNGTGATIDPGGPAADAGKGDCESVLEVVYRDFDVSPDFEWPSDKSWSGDVVRRGLIEPVLGPDHKPVFKSSTGFAWKQGTPLAMETWTGKPVITSADTFKQWYNATPGVNQEFKRSLDLTETSLGSGQYVFAANPFFPLTNDEGFKVTPPGSSHNYLFTTEIHAKFGYVKGQKFSFAGDDDLWIFVNGRLALDLGSMHSPADGTVDFDAQAADLAIVPGNTYTMDIFHAERHTFGSNFKITTNISCFSPPPAVQ